MKYFTSIFILIVFIFSQYVRQFSYLECRLIAQLSNSQKICDCENNIDNTSTENAMETKTSIHNNLDEFFIFKQSVLSYNPVCNPFYSNYYIVTFRINNARDIDHPPQI